MSSEEDEDFDTTCGKCGRGVYLVDTEYCDNCTKDFCLDCVMEHNPSHVMFKPKGF